MELLRKVKCTDRLPEKEGKYYVKTHDGNSATYGYMTIGNIWLSFNGKIKKQPIFWYESIEVELDSEKILPYFERVIQNHFDNKGLFIEMNTLENTYELLVKYHNALEAVELKNVELKEELREVKGMLDYTNKLNEEFRFKQEKDLKRISEHFKFRNPNEEADERYNKAYKFAEIQCCTGLVCIDLDTVNDALKIAAYGK